MKTAARFVIQKHAAPDTPVHWDLMLEAGGVLQTYRIPLPPQELLKTATTAVRILDHPLKFLTYEGKLSRNKGTVQIADAGTYQLVDDDENHQQIQLDGRLLRGTLSLTHIENDRWELHFLREGTSGST